MAFLNIILGYAFITIIGFITGRLLKIEHDKQPLPEVILDAWPKLSILGLIFSDNTAAYYFMAVVTIGWFFASRVELDL